jgi:APA family basic amino acid/polyamine antiporter
MSLFGLSASGNASLVAIGLIGVLAVVNLGGIRKAARADLGLVVVKLAILLAVVGFAIFYWMSNGSATNFLALSTPTSGVSGIFGASVAVFFAYSGFQTISSFTSKVKGGARSAARAILLSVSISMVLYVLIAFSLLTLLPANRFVINADPLSFALSASHAPGYLTTVVEVGALVATASASLAVLLGSSRILYQIGADGLLPRAARAYDAKRDVARNGVLISAVIAIVMLYAGNVFVIAAMSNFGLLFSYLIATLALVHFRRLGKRGTFRVPGYPYLPLIAFIAILSFMIGMPREALVVGTILVLTLIIAYYSLREYREKEPVKIRFFD